MSRPNIVAVMETFGNFKQAVQRYMSPIFKEHGISSQQWHMLYLLEKPKNGMTTTELAEAAQITPGAVSQFIEQLAEKGFINRSPQHNDRRQINITIAPEAFDRIATLKTAQRKILTELFNCLTEEELQTFMTLLQKVSRHTKIEEKHA